ncbi:hypothetical protein NECAME_15244 [Necator americanus]|uniref:Uncharacterized protein n=1 Tax=Necator americanus TaxID=51031 RepID=W2SIZ4_NECAM|nr:hypothetical protein NECAME_15244 [Necator americanus]ETN69543.1 hypothetical protein NECAME_15244 [Necator americanus]
MQSDRCPKKMMKLRLRQLFLPAEREMNLFGSCLPYFGNCLECMQGPSFSATASYSQMANPLSPSIRLDVAKSVVVSDEVTQKRQGGHQKFLVKEAEKVALSSMEAE